MRMRYRRAERCLLRADVALEAGFPEDAREALAEARALAPQMPGLDELEARIANPPVIVEDVLGLPADIAAESQPPTRTRRAASLMAMAAACAMFAVVTLWPDRNEQRGEIVEKGVAVAAPVPAVEGPSTSSRPVDIGVEEIRVPSSAVDAPAPKPEDDEAVAPRPNAKSTPASPAVSEQRASEVVRTPPAAVNASRETLVPASLAPVPTIGTTGTASMPEVTASAPSLPSEPPPSAIPAAPPAPEPPTIAPSTNVRATLSRYESAYSQLDANAARAVYPTLNARALSRAFDSLSSQRVSLGDCSVDVQGSSARARCAGSATYTPKIGGGTRTESRQWDFTLRQRGDNWEIVQATVR